MRKSDAAREKDKEAIKKQAQTLWDFVDAPLTLLLPLLLFAPLETLLRLYRVNDVRDDRSAHGQRHTLALDLRRFHSSRSFLTSLLSG